jgi:hypothetical protein
VGEKEREREREREREDEKLCESAKSESEANGIKGSKRDETMEVPLHRG